MATYVNDLRLTEIATGDETGDWGATTNTNLELIAEAFSFGTEAITTNADTHTTTIADGGTDPGRSLFLKYTGTLDSACTITIAPNTVSKLWFIENGTSGSQNIIISQGSGANITIPPGDTKAIYSDGAGSGAAMVDAFASLSVVDLKVQDDLTVTDDLIVNGDIDLEGSIDVNGTTNLDVVDIDGAVNMATTALVTGVLTTTAATVHTNGITMPDSAKAIFGAGDDLQIYHDGSNSYITDNGTGNLRIRANNLHLQNASGTSYLLGVSEGEVSLYHNNAKKFDTTATGIDVTGTVTATGTSVFASLDISGDIDVDGTLEADFITVNSIGGLGNVANDLAIYSTSAGHNGLRFHVNGILPTNNAGAIVNADADLGDTSYRFKDAYLSGALNAATMDLSSNAVIDGTALVTGVLTTTAATVFNGGFAANAASTIATTDNSVNLTLTSTDADANGGPKMFFYRNSSSPAAGDVLTQINHQGENDAGETINYMYQNFRAAAVGDGAESGQFDINTMSAGTAYERLGIDPTETVFNQDSADLDFRVESDNLTHALFVQGSDGNVGINKSVPAAPLHVVSSGNQDGKIRLGGDGTYYSELFWDYSASAFEINTVGAGLIAFSTGNNAEAMRITSAGNVGIGESSPVAKAHIQGSGTSGQVTASFILENSSSGTAGMDITGSAGASRLRFLYGGGPGTGTNSLTEAMSILTEGASAGNVGIGTSSPSTMLHIESSSGNASAQLTSGTSGTSYINMGDTGNVDAGQISYINNGDAMAFTAGAAERMRIDSNGRITATANEYIGSSRGDAGVLFHATSSSGNGSGIDNYFSSLTSGSNNTNCSHFKGTTQGVASYYLHGNGSSTWSSDRDLKRDIETTRDGYLDDINKLRVVKYKWKNDSDSLLELGLIAQEVETVFPSLVVDHENAIGDEVLYEDGDTIPEGKEIGDVKTEGTTYKGIKYSVLPVILLKTVQELSAKLEAAEARITALEG